MTSYADLPPRSRMSIDRMTLHLVSLPIPGQREMLLRQFEQAIAQGYRESERLSAEAAAANAAEWIGILRSRVAAAELFSRLPLSPNA
jgi:hypothetical protein